MARLYLFAEGKTEQTFAGVVLKPHLAGFGVHLGHVVLIANKRHKGRVNRGGGRHYPPMKNDIGRFLKQESGRDVFFTTMIDLYALHVDFPGYDDAEKLRHLPAKRVESLESSFGSDINDSRFIPYIQLHEFEAILFCDPSAFGTYDEDAEKRIASLQKIADAYASPEAIDDGQHTAPSKRIEDVFPD